jgi:flagellar basal body-associated protein FliL
MNGQNNPSQKPLDQKHLSVWIGVTIVLIAGAVLVAYMLFMAANPGATVSMVGR